MRSSNRFRSTRSNYSFGEGGRYLEVGPSNQHRRDDPISHLWQSGTEQICFESLRCLGQICSGHDVNSRPRFAMTSN
ncbi:hypothetical protein M408DRAFT_206750 [Serendipita vermifera MAFF 305830]|uniref:Uncharacterized protein n=1 Tax=Serendipita vermifera MAFF 305830 TaxID=933852 RepID=A0A0C2X929_SERVB|nr:hypothetical protein M408DRAFT_206750 [Serendipita vermifera MAFF 305830]